jgi:hypothetical protein
MPGYFYHKPEVGVDKHAKGMNVSFLNPLGQLDLFFKTKKGIYPDLGIVGLEVFLLNRFVFFAHIGLRILTRNMQGLISNFRAKFPLFSDD